MASTALTTACFHCGLPVPAGTNFRVHWKDATHVLCCRGCEAVARAIIDSGLDNYYRLRTANAPTAQELLPDALSVLTTYDHPAVQQSFVRRHGSQREATLILEGITCAACVWLNEQHLRQLPGIEQVQVNYSTRRARVTWNDEQIRLSDILHAIRAIGYDAHPFDPARSEELFRRERHTLLRRLGIAGIFGAQVMTLGVALYLGDWGGSDPALRDFFYWISLLLTLPVLLYSAQPFFRAAWNDLRHARAGMDVPIALGLGAAFLASLWTTLAGDGIVYYDSVTMFVFFLLGGRYVELAARARANEAAETLVRATPAIATRLDAHGEPTHIAVAELAPGDIVLVRPGENIPADARVVSGRSSVNGSLLTGESLPRAKAPGDDVIGGSINVESPLTLRVTNTGVDTVLSSVLRLLDRAQAEKPALAQLADRVAAWFVVGVLLLAGLVGLYWWQHDSARAIPIMIAVLVVTCPCALGLATPAALAAATGALARNGLLVTRGHALETLARATHFVFDKTGTLTHGELRVSDVKTLAGFVPHQCLALAAALERHSEHPVARAILDATLFDIHQARDVKNHPGEGLHGTVDGQPLFLGTPAFVARCSGQAFDPALLADLRRHGGTVVALASSREPLALFVLEDSLRPDAAALIAQLKRLGKHVLLLTGDHPQAAQRVAAALGIDELHAELTPDQKLAHLHRLQATGAIVAMIGDGVNDAPVLAAAQVSIAMRNAAHVSAAAADMILLTPALGQLLGGIEIARRSVTVIRQNLAWASAYNLLAVPAAAMGLVSPWIAALGMSLSSLLVVVNALRLTAKKKSPTNVSLPVRAPRRVADAMLLSSTE